MQFVCLFVYFITMNVINNASFYIYVDLLKEIVHPKVKMDSLFTLPLVVLKPNECLSSVGLKKIRFLRKVKT